MGSLPGGRGDWLARPQRTEVLQPRGLRPGQQIGGGWSRANAHKPLRESLSGVEKGDLGAFSAPYIKGATDFKKGRKRGEQRTKGARAGVKVGEGTGRERKQKRG